MESINFEVNKGQNNKQSMTLQKGRHYLNPVWNKKQTLHLQVKEYLHTIYKT